VTRDRGPVGEDTLLGLHERLPERYPVLLESVGGALELGRYDMLLANPGESLVLHADGRLEGPGSAGSGGRFLAALDAWWRAERQLSPDPASSPFTGGWFLYLGYELAGEIEPTLRLPPARLPVAVAWRMRGAVLHDRETGSLACRGEPDSLAVLERELDEELTGAREHGEASGPGSMPAVVASVAEEPPGRFLTGVAAVLEAIGRGDVYQANLSRGWSARLRNGAGAAELYRRLRRANPAPFAGIARMSGFTLLSSSPERLLRIRGSTASTRPIAGTRPRGASAAADDTLRAELVLNEKERAEHVMLVDTQRPRPHLSRGHGAGRRVHDGRDLRDRPPHRLERHGGTARGRHAG